MMNGWSRIRWIDPLVVCFLLAVGICEILSYQRAESLGADSSIYMVLGRNLAHSGVYEFNNRPHTVYPPGFPWLLAGITWLSGGDDYGTFVRWMPVFTTGAFLAWYFTLRTVWRRKAAAAACLLTATAAPVFRAATRDVLSDIPYLLVSGLAFLCLVALRGRRAENRWRRALLGTLFVLLTPFTVLTRSAGLALCAALLFALFLRVPTRTRVWMAAGALAGFLGIGGWSLWARTRPVDPYGGKVTYGTEFTAKDPHRPDSGPASAEDLAERVLENVPMQASHLAGTTLRIPWTNPIWYSPFAWIPLGLIVAGIFRFRRDPLRVLLGVYFAAYFGIYTLWPFDEGPRYMVPVLPLAICLVWQGLQAVAGYLATGNRMVFQSVAVISIAVGLSALLWGHGSGLQATLSEWFWLALAGSAAVLWWKRPDLIRVRQMGRTSRAVGVGIVGSLLAVGAVQDYQVARANLHPDPKQFRHAASANSSAWLAQHPGVVMAQQTSILHRMLQSRVANFPITAKPDTLIEAVKREHVRYLVVNDPVPFEYYSPSEQERMQVLQSAFPGTFLLRFTGVGFRIYEVDWEKLEGK